MAYKYLDLTSKQNVGLLLSTVKVTNQVFSTLIYDPNEKSTGHKLKWKK